MADKVYLSASRIDTFLSCSAIYAARYIHKVPDIGNDGANRGSVVHEILELLLKKKHRVKYDRIMAFGSCEKEKSIWKLIKKLAKKYNVSDEKNLETIDKFIMVALKNDFFGTGKVKEIFGEKEFTIEYANNGKQYNIRGFIDQTFIIDDKDGLIIEIRDFKTSKAKFDEEKLTDNIQSLMYQLALKHLYPDIKKRKFHFLFLKFPRDPRQDQPSFTDEQLGGFEWRLTFLQQAMQSFTEKNSKDNLAALNKEHSWLCGKEGTKKDGNPFWICSVRKPIEFFVLLDKNNKIVQSEFDEKKLTPKSGERIEHRKYNGCPYYYNESGKKRNFN